MNSTPAAVIGDHQDSPAQAEGSPPAAPVSQPTISASTVSLRPEAVLACSPDGFDFTRDYNPPARRPRATRPPADAPTMAETIAVMVGAA